ncbi:hypothetical protein [Okeania sp. SIO3I5]|nr:hypothetical protein [Okeania sp. SIO3I5]
MSGKSSQRLAVSSQQDDFSKFNPELLKADGVLQKTGFMGG